MAWNLTSTPRICPKLPMCIFSSPTKFEEKKNIMRFCYMALLFIDFEETYKQRLTWYERTLRDKCIPREALKFWSYSPWLFMFKSGNDQALANMTGTDHRSFRLLLDVFEPYWDSHVLDRQGNVSPRKRRNGRPRMLSALGGLGLVLTWYRTKGARSRNLAIQFGMTNSPMSYWLWFAMRCLRSALVDHPQARICKPTAEEVETYKSAISAKYPSLPNVWAAVD